MTLTGKTALVTGGSRGIGRAVARRLAADGARVVFTYQRAKDAAELLAAEIGATAVRCDQADLDTLPAIFEPVRDGLDILVNNAGIAVQQPIAELTAAEFDRVLTINTKFPLFALQAAIPLLPDGGRVVNISTLNTAVAGPGLALYCASKAALEQVTSVAARELGPRGITVNTVSPGATDTDMLRAVNTPQALERAAGLTALGRLGQPSDVASVVAFLAGPDGAWITGQNLRATGGLMI
ncbi:SDR family oxidoreductase [Actinoplanes couchii]|uniref:3-oxoacyl-ACP reductase n=1 Tax=Actinoplanes couchii TaxID=403638 RepID=A0ABQ3X933_9ACTN|nr:SDR family oxidoreductase [Actinoplanes couchii]MDR6325816.1 3-oxoacyl-[acyl-carrier protein] reductase [Actinoplanes couchii]GID55015.1 3-oxoacyl-ACP reductase [Actinoplanes couchii]